jgi:hypothetical protein
VGGREVSEIGRIGLAEGSGGTSRRRYMYFFKLQVDCVSYLSGDYYSERLFHFITLLFFMLLKHININIHYSITLLFIM